MKKIKHLKLKIFGIILLCLAIGVGYIAYEYVQHQNGEPSTSMTSTNTDPAIYNLKKLKTKLLVYPTFNDITINAHPKEIDNGTYIIPGMKATKTLGLTSKKSEMCTTMTPQGVTSNNKYIFVSEYCHTHSHNSVIQVLNKQTHKYIKTIILRNKPHVGGIAYDSENDNLWYAASYKGFSQAIGLSLKSIEDFDDSSNEPIKPLHEYALVGITKNSFMTYFYEGLYVGFFTENNQSVVERYDINESGGLDIEDDVVDEDIDDYTEEDLPSDIILIPGEVQGVDFYKDYMIITKSDGYEFSHLEIYKRQADGLYGSEPYKTFVCPERMEQICIDNDECYVTFEGASYAYDAIPMTRIDRVFKMDLARLNLE